jgi:hypothetical protein
MKKLVPFRLRSTFNAPVFLAFMLATLFTVQLSAQNPKISMQGALKSANGTSVPDGTYTVIFRLYTTETGGSPVWEETAQVDVVGGIYSHYLGSITALEASDFSTTLYLGVRLGSYELVPRSELAYSPYSFAVNSAQNAVSAQTAQRADTADIVLCSGAVGDVKYSFLNPTQFAKYNGDCWVPLDGGGLPLSSALRQETGITTLPDAGGLFVRAQEFSGGDNNDPERDASTTIGTIQDGAIQSHRHTVSQTTIRKMSNDDDLSNQPEFDRGNGVTEASFPIPPDPNTSFTGGAETRPKNLNLWIYVRIN